MMVNGSKPGLPKRRNMAKHLTVDFEARIKIPLEANLARVHKFQDLNSGDSHNEWVTDGHCDASHI